MLQLAAAGRHGHCAIVLFTPSHQELLAAGALEEVDWLRMKLERIEGALKAQAVKGGPVSRLLSRQPTTVKEASFVVPTAPGGAAIQMCAHAPEPVTRNALSNRLASHDSLLHNTASYQHPQAEVPGTRRDEFNDELSSLLRTIAEDAKTDRASDKLDASGPPSAAESKPSTPFTASLPPPASASAAPQVTGYVQLWTPLRHVLSPCTECEACEAGWSC